MTLAVYVAGSSRRYDDVKEFMRQVETLEDVRITHDWTQSVAAAARGGRPDHYLTDAQRCRFAQNDLLGVAQADVVVVLVRGPGIGMWVELGYALGVAERVGKMRAPEVIVVGGDRLTIFTAPGVVSREVESELEALAMLEAML